jgi:hypothetical protein
MFTECMTDPLLKYECKYWKSGHNGQPCPYVLPTVNEASRFDTSVGCVYRDWQYIPSDMNSEFHCVGSPIRCAMIH